MCEPCDEPSDAAMELGLVSCCHGGRRDQCGLAVDDGETCFALDVVGEEDASCPPVGPMGARHDGCCRVDGRCGARFEMLGLGASSRRLPDAIAPRADAIACEFACAEDVDCAGAPGVTTVCIPHRLQADDRHCAIECQRDEDCADGLVCALSPDVAKDRLVAFCQEPDGDREPNEDCTAANQCVHGACLQLTGQATAQCSEFCESDMECPEDRPFCVGSSIGRPSGEGDPIDFDVCSTRDN